MSALLPASLDVSAVCAVGMSEASAEVSAAISKQFMVSTDVIRFVMAGNGIDWYCETIYIQICFDDFLLPYPIIIMVGLVGDKWESSTITRFGQVSADVGCVRIAHT